MQYKEPTTLSDRPLAEVGSERCLYARRKPSLAGRILNIVIAVILVVIVFEIWFGSVYTGIYVVNSSMRNTLIGAESEYSAGGDFIFIDRHAAPDYGKIVVVYDAHMNGGNGENIIKRVVALGGDTVKMEYGRLYIKYKGTDEFVYVPEDYVDPDNNDPLLKKNSFSEHLVAENCMFLLGDNRNVSNDSRNPENGVNGDYGMDCLLGVVPDWSMSLKGLTTSWHTFFYFTLPSAFGA